MFVSALKNYEEPVPKEQCWQNPQQMSRQIRCQANCPPGSQGAESAAFSESQLPVVIPVPALGNSWGNNTPVVGGEMKTTASQGLCSLPSASAPSRQLTNACSFTLCCPFRGKEAILDHHVQHCCENRVSNKLTEGQGKLLIFIGLPF